MKANYRYLFFPLLILLLVFPIAALAQMQSSPDAEFLGPGERFETDDFGTAGWAVTFIPASAFQQRDSGTYSCGLGQGYCYATGGSNWWHAPMNVPNGVDIYAVRLYYYDNSGSNLTWWLTRYTGTTTVQDISFATSSGTPGYTSGTFDPIHIVDNRYGYMVIILQSAYGNGLQFRGARISWRRVIGPAGAQQFWDVPPGAPFYQEINNLARSGITTGYPDGSYQPNSTVTRGQMAAFLSRGFGLYQGFNTPNP